MKTLLVSTALGIAALVGADVVGAQQPGSIASLVSVEGNVLVSQGDAMVAAVGDQRLPAGARVVITGGGKAVIRYDNGCEIQLKENQRFLVRVGDCAALLSEVVTLGPGTGTAAAGGIGSGTVVGILGGVGFGFAAYEFFKKPSVSPN